MTLRLKPGSRLIGVGLALTLWQAFFGVALPLKPDLAHLAEHAPPLDAAALTRAAEFTMQFRWPLVAAILCCILIGGIRRRRSQRAERGGLDHRSAFFGLVTLGAGVLFQFWSPETLGTDPRQLTGAAGILVGLLGFAWACGRYRKRVAMNAG